MIRIENRCDRVRIASYAPLFCNEDYRKWSVNPHQLPTAPAPTASIL